MSEDLDKLFKASILERDFELEIEPKKLKKINFSFF